jgi:hypothetical protein
MKTLLSALLTLALLATPAMAFAADEICDNETDEDGDGFIDCDDWDCDDDPACEFAGEFDCADRAHHPCFLPPRQVS